MYVVLVPYGLIGEPDLAPDDPLASGFARLTDGGCDPVGSVTRQARLSSSQRLNLTAVRQSRKHLCRYVIDRRESVTFSDVGHRSFLFGDHVRRCPLYQNTPTVVVVLVPMRAGLLMIRRALPGEGQGKL